MPRSAGMPPDLRLISRSASAASARKRLASVWLRAASHFLCSGKGMRSLAHEAVRFQGVAEAVGEGVFEAVVIHRRFQIDALRAGEGDDADHLAHFVGEREEELAVLDFDRRFRIFAARLRDEIAQLRRSLR